MQLVIGAGRTAAIQSRFRSVTAATTPSRRRPWASRARQPVGPGVERPIGQGAVAVHGRDGVRVVPHVLLEQLVDPTVRYRSPRAGEPFERWRSPDGHTLATASVDQTVLLWDLTDLTRPRRLGDPLTGHTDGVNGVAFAPDGHTLATASGDQTVLLWDLSGLQKIQSNPIGRAYSLTGRGLNADEWGVVAPDVPYVDSCST